jgi:hypothetical protein
MTDVMMLKNKVYYTVTIYTVAKSSSRKLNH